MKTVNHGIAAPAGLSLAFAGNSVAATDEHAAGHANEPAAKL